MKQQLSKSSLKLRSVPALHGLGRSLWFRDGPWVSFRQTWCTAGRVPLTVCKVGPEKRTHGGLGVAVKHEDDIL